MLEESVDSGGAPAITPPSSGAMAIVRALLAGRTLAIRLVVAGTLLVVGLPVLTILVFVWGYPSSAPPRPLVVLVDGLQILIVLNAVMVVAQLVAGTRLRVRRMSGRHSQTGGARQAPLPLRRSGPMGLRGLALSLAEILWEHERNTGAALSPAVLDYIRDAVTAELEHRRRTDALALRLANLEAVLSEGSAAKAPDHDRR